MIQAVQRAIRGLASDLAQRYLERARTIWSIETAANWLEDPDTTLQLVGAIAEVAIARRSAASTMMEVRAQPMIRPVPQSAKLYPPSGRTGRTRKWIGSDAVAQDPGLDLALSAMPGMLSRCRRLRLCG